MWMVWFSIVILQQLYEKWCKQQFNIISGDFAAFEDKKTLNAFDLFISGSNAKKGIADKERKIVEKDLQAKIYTAVKAKDTTSLNKFYNEFIKVADLKVNKNDNKCFTHFLTLQ